MVVDCNVIDLVIMVGGKSFKKISMIGFFCLIGYFKVDEMGVFKYCWNVDLVIVI